MIGEEKVEKPWLFKKGQSGNPAGRPKGTFSLKTYAKKYLQEMTDEEKLEFMEGLPKEVIWRMAEGNPKQDTEMKAEVTMVKPLLDNIRKNVCSNDSPQEDTGTN